MSHQSYRDVFVSNNPALLKSGSLESLAVNQLGIFIYDPKKEQTAVYPPNYATTREIQIIQGTPDLAGNLLGAVANDYKRSKPIKGKKILSWSGRKAERGQTQKIALGYDGVDTTKNITALCEQSKTVFIKLSGGPIDELYHTEGRGFVKQFNLFSGCCDDCGDDCAAVSAEAIADDLVKQVMGDPIYSLGTRTGNKVIRARKIISSASPDPDATCLEYTLSLCDNGDDTSLGLVQGQFSGDVITRKSRTDATSVYSFTQDAELDAPADYTNEGLVLINDCAVCPSGAGYVSVGPGFAYKVTRSDAGNDAALVTLKADYGIDGSAPAETALRLTYQFGQSTYIIVSETEAVASDPDVLLALGETRNSCILTAPTVVSWEVGDTLNRFNKTYSITLNDSVCGTSRLLDLQAAYPDLVIVEAITGDCIRKFTTTVLSDCTVIDCPPDVSLWTAPEAFEGIEWTASTAAGDAVNVGVIFESSFVDRVTNECAFDFWRYDAEPIFIEISQHSQDYNDKPTVCADEWAVTEIQAVKIPIGVGSRVREDEAFFKGYERKYRDWNPIVREGQDSILQADPNSYYDQYTLATEFQYHQAWFSEKETDSYRYEFYFKEGQGKQFETAINSYVSSIGIDLDPVYL